MIKPFSYSFWAVLIVCRGELLNLLAASCCRVLVVKGGFGFDVLGFSTTLETCQLPELNSFSNDSAWVSESCKELMFFLIPVFESKSLLEQTLAPFSFTKLASNFGLEEFFERVAFRLW